jgi:excisionase family DNA binding protein
MNVELHGLEETIRAIVREEVAAALAMQAPAEWLSSAEAAHYLGISVGHLHNLVGGKNPTVPSHKVGGRRRYRRSELDDYQGGRRA